MPLTPTPQEALEDTFRVFTQHEQQDVPTCAGHQRGAHSIATIPSERIFTPSYYPDLGLPRFDVGGACGMQGEHRAAFAPSERHQFPYATSRSSDASFERNARGFLAHKLQECIHTRRHVHHTPSRFSKIGCSVAQSTRGKAQIRRRRCIRPYSGHSTECKALWHA